MVRNYKGNPHGKTYRKIDPAVMERAKNAVRGTRMTIRQASRHYNIPYTVLHRHLKKRDIKKQGGQTTLSKSEEDILVEKLLLCAEWGYPVDIYALRHIVKGFLDRKGKVIKKFKDNLPGRDFAMAFLKRHKNKLAVRFCQNIKRSRAAVSPATIKEYFDNLEIALKNIPPCNIVNYDETNLCNDPGRTKIIAKRGCKYPERVMNQTKTSISLMFAASGDGIMLPVYVIYKAKHLYSTWLEGAPKKTRFNCTTSGWFDGVTFTDWVKTVAIPYLKNKEGQKILIGDNLSSHLSEEAVSLCAEHNIRFIFLPSNSTHLTQPLDVAFFRPLKTAWRKILTDWKRGPGMKEPSIPKSTFPHLLTKLITEIQKNSVQNIQSGFSKTGINPLDRQKVLNMLPKEPAQSATDDVEREMNNSLTDYFRQMRYGDSQKRTKKKSNKRVHVEAGKSIRFEEDTDNSDAIEDADSQSENSESLSANLEFPNADVNSEWDDDSDVENIDPSSPQVVKFGRTFKNVYEITENQIKKGDWLLVSFSMESKKAGPSTKLQFFIGQVINICEPDYEGNFLRGKTTRDFSGYIYTFPQVKDTSMFTYNQVVGRLTPPEKFLRGENFKFQLNFYDL